MMEEGNNAVPACIEGHVLHCGVLGWRRSILNVKIRPVIQIFPAESCILVLAVQTLSLFDFLIFPFSSSPKRENLL